jgi:hypothetical protein
MRIKVQIEEVGSFYINEIEEELSKIVNRVGITNILSITTTKNIYDMSLIAIVTYWVNDYS